MSICIFWQLYENLIPLMLKQTFHMGDALSGAIMAMDNVLALFLLPIFGSLSDKVQTPLGRRIPFIIAGTALSVLFMLMLPVADRLANLVFFMIALFLTLISMGIYRSPAVALMPDLTSKPLRSKANAVIDLMGAIGGILALLLIKLLVPAAGSRPDSFSGIRSCRPHHGTLCADSRHHNSRKQTRRCTRNSRRRDAGTFFYGDGKNAQRCIPQSGSHPICRRTLVHCL